MAAYLILLFAVLSRFVPHLLHTPAWGVTALGGGLLCFGSRLGRAARWQAVFAVLAIAASDWWLTTQVYGFPFHVSGYVVTWIWYALVCVVAGAGWLHRRRTAGRVVGAAIASSTGFFLLSNGMVWADGSMYARTAAGLAQCYAAGLPFYRNDTISTLVVCGLLFGVPALARRMSEASEHEGAAA